MRLLLRMSITLLVSLPGAASSAENALPRSVLFLDQSIPYTAWLSQFFSAFQSTLKVGSSTPITVYSERLEYSHFRGEDYDKLLRTFLKERYREKPIGIIMAIGLDALQFAMSLQADLNPRPLIIFGNVDERAAVQLKLPPDITGITVRWTPRDAVIAARVLVPNLKRIALVGDPFEKQTYRRHYKQELPIFAGDLEYIDLTGLAMTDLRGRVAALPENTAIFFTTLSVDGAGASYDPNDALAMIAEVANRPIVIDQETRLGYGGAGGFLRHAAPMSEDMARLALRLFNGESALNIPITTGEYTKPVFDWRALKRWNVNEGRLPPGSEIRFRDANMLEEYRWQIMLTAAAMVVQMLLIAGLLYQRCRRRDAEVAVGHRMAELAHMANHDALTDLPNRVFLRDRLEQELAYVRRGGQLAVLYLDIDRFKSVNDTLGHSTGDELLKAAAERLRGGVREADFIARLGGDEFAIVQTALGRPVDAAIVAQRLRDEMTGAPFELNGHQIVVDISVGIALAPSDGTDADRLLRSADMALCEAKSEGRGTYRYFEPGMDVRTKTRRALEVDLRKALANGEFELYYQPIVRLQDNEISGCEALLRWHHPERGMIPPADFIPVAEETGLMMPIGEWVVRRACTDAMAWPTHMRVAVNVSPVQLRNETWDQIVVGALAASGLSPRRLEVEITESLFMQSNEATIGTLHQLRELGVRIAMDDFGTGYSSLSYLRSFPFDRIKIDRSFIEDLANSDDSLKIVQAVAGLASGLKMATTAEGVETERQLEVIRAAGCTEMQGYLFSRPRPASDILQLVLPRWHVKSVA